MSNDYSLLRPFDLEAAKRGEAICDRYGSPLTYIAGPDSVGDIVYLEKDGCGEFGFQGAKLFRMAPLAWVEGKPVYKGDVLWNSITGDKRTVSGIRDGGSSIHADELHPNVVVGISYLTWNPPKVKREGWVNIYRGLRPAHIHCTEEAADRAASSPSGKIDPNRMACVRIEWEEPAQ